MSRVQRVAEDLQPAGWKARDLGAAGIQDSLKANQLARGPYNGCIRARRSQCV